MKPAFVVFAILMATSCAGSAGARVRPNIGDRLVRAPDGALQRLGHRDEGVTASARTALPAAVARLNALLANPAPLPAGALQLDSTYYDLQDMGSLGTRIVSTTDGRIHVAYEDDFCELDEFGCPPDPNGARVFPRAMAYAVRDAAGTWTRVGKVQDPTLTRCPQCAGSDTHGGFGTLAVLPSGRVAMATHMNEDGCDLRGDLYVEDASGGAAWSAYLTPLGDPLFPQVAALPNGSFTLMGEVPLAGSYEETQSVQITRLGALGGNFTCPTGWQFGAWTSPFSSALFRDGLPAFPSIAVSSNGRCGIAVGDFGGNMLLVESSDGTFSAGTVTIRNLTNYSDAAIVRSDSASTEFRPYIHCHLAYNDTTPNVVWSELQARRIGMNLRYFDHRSRIRHWNPVQGVSTVKQVAAGEADRYDDLDQGLTSGPLSGFNTISVDWPQVGFSSDGSSTYVVWLRFVDAEIDPTANAGLPGVCTGIGYGDIACNVRPAGGAWGVARNLTQTPTTDERFVSLATRNDGGRVHLIFQASATDQAGVSLIGDRGSSPGNLLRRIAYMEPVVTAPLAVGDPPAVPPSLRAFPNPAHGRVRFALGGAGRGETIEIFSVHGRHVATVRAGAGDFEWNARDDSGHAVAGGIYFARPSSAPRAAVKFLLFP